MIIRVGTWNIREGRKVSDNQPFDPVKVVGHLGLDILALQEVPFTTRGDSMVLAALSRGTELNHAGALPVHDSVFDGSRSGLALLSRFPQADLRSTRFDARGLSMDIGGVKVDAHEKAITRVVCSTPAGPVTILNVHLFPFHRLGLEADSARFQEVWRALELELARSKGYPTILIGDFNTPQRSLAIPMGGGYQRIVGDRETHEGFASDDIVVSRHFRSRQSTLLANPSDHLLCLADLELTE